MVFSSLEFIVVFLPITVFLYYICLHFRLSKVALAMLVFASLFYYAYWNPKYIWVILASIAWNFSFGCIISANKTKLRKLFFIIGVLGNVCALAYFKYTDFSISTINSISGMQLPTFGIVLPIGISFFTFQQIAYLVDTYKKISIATTTPPEKNYSIPHYKLFLDYCLFVCFFPQLVAGPIVHHAEMMPQFADKNNKKVNWENIYWGIVLLSIGLAKKVIIADNISPIVIFAFEKSVDLTFIEAFVGSLAYTFQLYFDFSGYSDMAVGAGLLFNIHLPFNFSSPYMAVNIQDFWRRWHITLSRWLKEYIYIPLGGNRKGKIITLINLFLTFLIGGIWHGAAWTFVLWGALHGFAIVAHRIWVKSNKKFITIPKKTRTSKFSRILNNLVNLPAIVCTFLFVNFTWILFRAPNFERVKIFTDGLRFDTGPWFREEFLRSISGTSWEALGIAIIIVFVAKSSRDLYLRNKLSRLLSLYSIALLVTSIMWIGYLIIHSPGTIGEFIYFQF